LANHSRILDPLVGDGASSSRAPVGVWRPMTRDELNELGFIAPIASVPSIVERGILSHRLASKVPHQSIANESVQSLRATKRVPGGMYLHDYANLYICSRNPMLYVKRDVHETVCVLRVSTDVLDLPNVVITNANAARTFAKFLPAPEGLEIVDRELTFAKYWTHDDPDEQYRRKGLKCAEVLVPNKIHPKFIMGAYVSCQSSRTQLTALAPILNIGVNPWLFFIEAHSWFTS